MSRLSAAKLYRGFESTSLRHAVWSAEKLGYVDLKIAEIAAILQMLRSNRTGESVLPYSPVKLSRLFLWRAHWQSRFNDSIRRMQCDYKSMGRRKPLDLFVCHARNVTIYKCVTLADFC